MIIASMIEPSAYDAQCLYEATLEKLRIEYNITSQKRIIAAQAIALIHSYFDCPKMRESALRNFYLR
jgi:galactose mutarotase-like enzyme